MDISPDQALVELQRANEALRQLLDEQRAERNAALAEVMEVINRSPGDPQPGFQTILEKAHSLCGAAVGAVFTCDGEYFRAVATRGFPEQHDALVRRPFRPNTHHMELMRSGRPAHIPDLKAIAVSPDDEVVWNPVERTDVRTLLAVPLRKDGAVVGWISAFRNEVRLFSESEIALLENFAAQAVIAMENARLLDELRQRTQDLQESLEYQTATGDVLKVISQSDGELGAVLDTLVETAARICRADSGFIFRFNDDLCRMVASFGNPAEYREFAARNPIAPGRGTTAGRTVLERHVVHIEDAATDPEYTRVQALEMARQHTMLGVPLVREDSLIGVITLARSHVEAFTEKQIALVSTFADQAVIAIENARLLTEQQEALEQQTATAEVLRVINTNPGDVTPVFEMILDKAHSLCGALTGSLSLYNGQYLQAAALYGYPEEHAAMLRRPYALSVHHHDLISGKRICHIPDLHAAEELRDHPVARNVVRTTNLRTVVLLPLRKEELVLGFITALRPEVRSFSKKEIALLENFAAQAVIAIENARLLDELRQRQDELRVTFENMGGGVAMFDETPRLVAWNRKFQELLDVPDGVLAERLSYDDYIRYLVERGEYGPDVSPEAQLQFFRDRISKLYAFERTRPNGRVLEIRHNPVEDGGFVLIYADITERKRGEEELRNTHDAAEEASRTIEAAYRDLKAAQANLIQAEKMASLGQLTAGIAHEIKNPLNFVNNFATLSVDLLDELKEAAAPALATLDDNARADVEDLTQTLTGNLRKIEEHGKRADGIVKSMLEHSRSSSGERRAVDLNVLVDEALNLAYHGARAQDQSFSITMKRDFADGASLIILNPQDMTRVCLNLFSNGFYAAHKRQSVEGSSFEPTVTVTTRDSGDAVEIHVRDNGIGITDDIRDKMFQPFFTTKPTGEGTGLGLSITYDIVTKQHGGTITVDSEVGAFTEFTVTIPRQIGSAPQHA